MASVNEASFVQTVAKRRFEQGESCRSSAAENSDHWLLRARRKRPSGGRAAEQRDELAPLHSITSSARASINGGTLRPSFFAVVRLITNSNFVACSIGKSPALVPVRILTM
jgi:hypothetical protein